MGPRAAALDAVDDGEDVFLGCRRLHDDHHFAYSWKRPGWNGTTSESSGARPLGLDAAALDTPTERLAKSPGGIRVGTTERPGPAEISGAGGRWGHDAKVQATAARRVIPGIARSRPACRPSPLAPRRGRAPRRRAPGSRAPRARA